MKWLFSLFLLFAVSLSAQSSFTLGLIAGPNVSKIGLHRVPDALSDTDLFDLRLGWQAGLAVGYKLSERSRVSFQPAFVRRGHNQTSRVGASSSMRVDYLDLPVVYRHRLIHAFYAEAGAFLGLRLGSQFSSSGEVIENQFVGALIDSQSDTDFGGILGIGYAFSDRLNASFRLTQGLVNFYPDIVYTDRNGSPLGRAPYHFNRSFLLLIAYNLF